MPLSAFDATTNRVYYGMHMIVITIQQNPNKYHDDIIDQ